MALSRFRKRADRKPTGCSNAAFRGAIEHDAGFWIGAGEWAGGETRIKLLCMGKRAAAIALLLLPGAVWAQ
ncbi:MAG: hypothetical protein ACRD2G_07310, partial [Terriglobia bacterium]